MAFIEKIPGLCHNRKNEPEKRTRWRMRQTCAAQGRMKIYGLQKMTLLDFPGKVACTVFLGGCDFHCPFCHNWELATGSYPAQMEDTQLLAFLKTRQGLLEGVAVTGGEPLLQDVAPLLRRIRALGFAVKLDTNGTHPERLQELLTEGLVDYVAMDIKNSPEHYSRTAGVEDLDLTNVKRSVQILLHSSIDYEFRTTTVAQLHEAQDFVSMGQWLRGAKRYYIQPFTDRDTVPFDGFSAPKQEDLSQYLEIMRRYVPSAAIRGAE